MREGSDWGDFDWEDDECVAGRTQGRHPEYWAKEQRLDSDVKANQAVKLLLG
jgi:hypothetical protein